MASAIMIARFESELRALRESHEASMDAQNAKYNLLLWQGGLIAVILATILAFLLTQPWS